MASKIDGHQKRNKNRTYNYVKCIQWLCEWSLNHWNHVIFFVGTHTQKSTVFSFNSIQISCTNQLNKIMEKILIYYI